LYRKEVALKKRLVPKPYPKSSIPDISDGGQMLINLPLADGKLNRSL
jgi:hypothetical protein